MRAILIVVAAAGVAHADPAHVVVMTDGDPSPLRATLAGRGAELAVAPLPQGSLRLERAADAQRAAQANHADASVWIDRDDDGSEVCVVSADGGFFRHAPLAGDASPRAFAAIATSLLDELLAPPEVKVDVHVDVTPPAPAITPPPDVRVAAPVQPTPVVAAPSSDYLWADRKLLELSTQVGTNSTGVAAELLFPVSPRVRIGLLGSAQYFLDDSNSMSAGTTLFLGGIETRLVGRNHPFGRGQVHFELGSALGIARDDMNRGMFAALRIAAVFQRDTARFAVSFNPTALTGFGNADAVPVYLVNLSWDLPL